MNTLMHIFKKNTIKQQLTLPSRGLCWC